MTIEAIDFFDSAKKEIALEGEIHSRNAISRAYYSAYHCALALNGVMPDHPGINCNAGVHERFITKLANCPAQTLGIDRETALKIKSLGYLLKQAKSARHKADYELLCDIDKAEAESQLALTEKILDKIKEVASLLSPAETGKNRQQV